MYFDVLIVEDPFIPAYLTEIKGSLSDVPALIVPRTLLPQLPLDASVVDSSDIAFVFTVVNLSAS